MRFIPLLGVSVLTLALSGCALLGFDDDDSEPTPAKTPEKQVAEVDKVMKALEPLTGDEESVPSSKKFFETMMDAGYKDDQLETTLDASPLGNEVPSKMFGVKTDKGCVVGEIRKGKATAELMPPSESTGACLLGKVDRPEGVKPPKGEERSKDGADDGEGHLPGEDINNKTKSPSSDEEGSSSEGESDAEAPSLGGE